MCVEIFFIHTDCRCIARIGTYTCASQSIKKQGFSDQCPNFKTTHQWVRAGPKTCHEHVGMVLVEPGVSDSEDELGSEGVKGKVRAKDKEKEKPVEDNGGEEFGGGDQGLEGIEARSNGDVDAEGDTDYDSDGSSSSSSGEEVLDPEDIVVISPNGKMDDESLNGDSEEDGYKGDNEASFNRERDSENKNHGLESQINRVTTPVFNKSTNTNEPSTSSPSTTVDDHDDENEWVNTSSPISPSPVNPNSKSKSAPPAFTDSPTKRSISAELTAAMASLSLTRTTPSKTNTRIPTSSSSTKSSVPRPTTARSVARPLKSSKSASENESGGLPYLRRTLSSGIPRMAAVSGVPAGGSAGNGSANGSQIPRRSGSTRSLQVTPTRTTDGEEAARRRLSSGRSLRNLVGGSEDSASSSHSSHSSGSGSSVARSAAALSMAPESDTTSVSMTESQLSAIETPSVSRRLLALAAAIAASTNEGNKGRGLRHVRSLSVHDKELPALPIGDLDPDDEFAIGVERVLPPLPRLDGDFDDIDREMEKLRRE